MKKKIIIFIIICFVLIIGIISYLVLNKRIISTVTLDINPSIELQLDSNDIVRNYIGLNDDGNKLLKDNINGLKIDKCINKLTLLLIENDYIKDGDITILLYSTGKIDNKLVENELIKSFREKEMEVHIISIDKVNEEDKELAKKYNISPAKAAYINTIKSNIKIDELKDKSLNELSNIKESESYCELGYILEGDSCIKEIDRIPALKGNVCPEGYYEYNNKCYKEGKSFEGDKLTCRNNYQLINNECVEIQEYDAHAVCESNEYQDGYCIKKKYVADAYEFCRDPGRTLYDHKCLATKPSINGGCLNGDMYLNGKCVNTRDDYYLAEWKCPNGEVKSNADGSLKDNDTKCYENEKVKVTSYQCENNDILIGDKCQIKNIEKPQKERICKNGFTKLENEICINLADIKEKVEGYYCEINNRLEGNMCVVYERKEVNH